VGSCDSDAVMMRCLKSAEASQSSYYDIASQLEVDIHVGLSEYEVGQRRRNHGYNEFDITRDDPLWKKYLDQASAVCVLSHYDLKCISVSIRYSVVKQSPVGEVFCKFLQ